MDVALKSSPRQERVHTFLIIKKNSTKYMGEVLYLMAKNTVFYCSGKGRNF